MRKMITCLLLMMVVACTSSKDPDGASVHQLEIHAGPNAAGPRLSTGPDGTVVLSWMEPDESGSTLWYSELTDAGWQPAKSVVSGANMFVNWADLPSVTALTETHWVAHWLRMAGEPTYAYHVVISQSFDRGRTWSEAIKPHTDDTPTEHGFVSLFPQDGKVAAIWLDGRKMSNEQSGDPTASGMTLRGAVIEADGKLHHEQLIDELICDCCQTDVAVAQSGPVAVYRNRTIDEVRDIFVARNVESVWTTGVALNNDNWHIAGCPVNGPAIAARGNRVAAAWFTVPEQQPAVQIKFSEDGGRNFGRAIQLATEGSLGHVDVVLLRDGSALVSWLRSSSSGLGDLVTRRVTADGDMGSVRQIASSVPARSVPQMVLAAEDLVFVWTGSGDTPSRIQSARIAVDGLK
jgi:hypothetical protein